MASDHWEGDDVIILFEREGSDKVIQVSGKTSDIKRTGGQKTGNSKTMFGNKTIFYRSGKSAYRVEIEASIYGSNIPMIGIGGTAHISASEIRGTDTDYRWRISVWATKPSNQKHNATTDIWVPKKAGAIGRAIYKDCYNVNFEESFARDEYWKGTLSFEFGPTDEDGYTNYFFQMTAHQGTTALTVLNTTAHKGTLTWNTTTPAWTGGYRT